MVVNIRSMTKKTFCVKNPFFAKNAVFSKTNVSNKTLFWLIQAPNMSKHISRNKGATIRASRKTAHDKYFYFGAKNPFFLQKMVAPSKISYSPKSVYWYQCFRVWKMVGAKNSVHSRPAGQPNAFAITYSHCLCIWVKNWLYA